MIGAEPHGTYNRILLSSVLGGFQDPSQLWLNPLEWYEEHNVFVHAGVKADTIDRSQRVSDSPSSPGIITSNTARSKSSAPSSLRAAAPPLAAETRKPARAR